MLFRSGLTCGVIIPEGKIAMGKLAQALIHGARVVQIEGNFDVYNLLNSRVPQGNVATYGAGFLTPSSLLGGRLFKFGAQVDW